MVASSLGKMPRLRLGTRGSPLALVQAHLVREALCTAHDWPPEDVEIVPIATEGDRIQDRPLAEIGGKALWTKTLDLALAEGRTDASVHSMKDVETIRPDAIVLVAMLQRADIRDRLVGAAGIDALPPGARVGTTSPRRAAQLRRLRPDLAIVPFRGNVATRLRRLEAGEAEATMLAAAGLDRLGQSDVGVAIEASQMLPAAAQGAVGIECRNDERTQALLAAIDHSTTYRCVAAERALLAALGGTCHSPIGVLAVCEGSRIHLRAEILSEDGTEYHAAEDRFDQGDDEAPARLARALLARASPRLAGLFACAS